MSHREEFLNIEGINQTIEDILKGFASSVVDFSIHEYSVFSLKHSDIDLNEPYQSFEVKFLTMTKDIFAKIDPRMWGPRFVETFISLDMQLVSTVFLNRTVKAYIKRVCETQVRLLEGNLSSASKIVSESLRENEFTNHHSSYSNTPQNANLNLILQHSFEPKKVNEEHAMVSSRISNVNILREALLDDIVDRHVHTDSEDDIDTPKSAIDLKKYNSCAREKKKPTIPSLHSDLYRSLSQCTDLSSISPVAEQNELMTCLVFHF